ncbi:2,3-bisphosphoglycerate-independent phosphoglycerate mutase [candidate division WWE3 bacterium]|uniref:2,3-bisphosphoglycerate-independent phosphoglycerate mutase n=1 Tax=candidate division WWE3 bacterium TaxID=2053526 RepID=A0A955LHH1_UNCKA|nr:2,3-bisphosphoglycerate-independent phosphoglycerate mutase [candidate division WWE3 bacterium]
MSPTHSRPKPLVLIVLDGWGIREESEGNAIAQAQTPYYDSLTSSYPMALLETCGESVGLPEGKAGNSETGHMNIGAGYIVEQDVMRISHQIRSGDFFENTELHAVADHVKQNQSSLHIMGLLSKANVHSEYTHLLALIDFAKKQQIENLYIHVFTDGRDSPPSEGIENIIHLTDYLEENQIGAIASIVGRYYAMDRDKRWDRTKLAYDLLTQGTGTKETDLSEAMHHAYDRGETDEFIKPIVMTDAQGSPLTTIKENDAVIFFNFRTDRPRQLTQAFVRDEFTEFERDVRPNNISYTTMTEYQKDVTVSHVLYPPFHVKNPFAKVISEHGLKQLHMAETEKVAHVTYFFNGGNEDPFEGEERIHIPSNREVATYDQAPEMKAKEITDAAVEAIKEDRFDFILINYANADMVAHSGNIQATIHAVETLDHQLKRLIPLILNSDGVVAITSDHGNAEVLFNVERNEIDTEHNV